MIVAVITSSDKLSSEVPIVNQLFKAGLPVLHLRKSKFSTKKLREYLNLIPKEFHHRIIIHSHHNLALEYKLKGIHFTRSHLKKKTKSYFKLIWYKLRHKNIVITRSFHHLESLTSNKIKYSYVFLNPFFSKTEPLKNHFDISINYLKKTIEEFKTPIYASGNITNENIHLLKKYGLHGVAISKIIWEDPANAVENYLKICNQLED